MWCFTRGLESAPPRGFLTSGKGAGQDGTSSESLAHLVERWTVSCYPSLTFSSPPVENTLSLLHTRLTLSPIPRSPAYALCMSATKVAGDP